MKVSKLPPIEVDIKELEKFKILTKQEGESMSKVIRKMISDYNKSKLGRATKKGLWEEYQIKIKSTGVTSTNYKDFLYGSA